MAHTCTHPKTRSRRERALAQRRRELEAWMERDVPMLLLLSDEEREDPEAVDRKIELALADVANLERKLRHGSLAT